jgi:hypothetical protein
MFNIIFNIINIFKFIHVNKFEINFITIKKKHICDLKGKINSNGLRLLSPSF